MSGRAQRELSDNQLPIFLRVYRNMTILLSWASYLHFFFKPWETTESTWPSAAKAILILFCQTVKITAGSFHSQLLNVLFCTNPTSNHMLLEESHKSLSALYVTVSLLCVLAAITQRRPMEDRGHSVSGSESNVLIAQYSLQTCLEHSRKFSASIQTVMNKCIDLWNWTPSLPSLLLTFNAHLWMHAHTGCEFSFQASSA